MAMLERRAVLAGLGALAAVLVLPRAARAGMARVLSLPELVSASSHVLQGLPLEAISRWETLGDERRIVTYTRVRSDAAIAGSPARDSEVLVRTLGGQVGNIGQVVNGEAFLRVNEACLLFLAPSSAAAERVVAMAQGHYPIMTDAAGVARLSSSPNLPHLVGEGASAVRTLVGLSVEQACGLIRAAR
jgi:hypothetical protein